MSWNTAKAMKNGAIKGSPFGVADGAVLSACRARLHIGHLSFSEECGAGDAARAFEPWLRLFGPHYFGKFRVFFPDGRLEIGLGCFQVHRAVK